MKHIFLALTLLLTTNAHAAQAQTESPLFFFAMVGVFIAFIYFTAWRPQSKRAKEHQTLLNSLSKGDEVVVAGGLLGKINKINDQFLELSLSDNVDVVVQKHAVTSLLPKGTIKSAR